MGMRVRQGKGFTLAELKAAGLNSRFARSIGIAVDLRRRNKTQPGFEDNVKRLETYKNRLTLFPLHPNKGLKKGPVPDTEVDESKLESRVTVTPLPVKQPALKIPTMEVVSVPEGSVYATMRLARMTKKWKGIREERERKAEEDKKK